MVEKEPDNAGLFASYFIFQCEDFWHTPDEVYLDVPFLDSGLRDYYKALGKDADRSALISDYIEYKIPVQRLVKFAEAVEVQVKLPVVEQRTDRHPFCKELQADFLSGKVHRTYGGEDKDWAIPHLKKALAKPTMKLAQAIWRTLQDLEPDKLEATFRARKQSDTKRRSSSLILALQKPKWIPKKEGGICLPCGRIARPTVERLPF